MNIPKLFSVLYLGC
uniref:Uncharacterized protein n=1 Tax=Anguilla anguilla TaxID=7936 RepID=A0A0E9PIF1_ANGAN